jgi:hypothetical protein
MAKGLTRWLIPEFPGEVLDDEAVCAGLGLNGTSFLVQRNDRTLSNAGVFLTNYPAREAVYALTCKCGAVEFYPYPEGVRASKQRCPACLGLAFGLRASQRISREAMKDYAPLFVTAQAK